MTASFFSEAAHYPTTLWISIAQTSLTHEAITASGRFSLILLHRDQAAIARRCGFASGRDTDKCRDLGLYRSDKGFWYLDSVIASVACSIRSQRTVGDHTLFIADILAGEPDTRHLARRHLLTADLL
jgi:flavin reductase (DIM6/NTAB) family NADH-FMN oxidoreductase RutF